MSKKNNNSIGGGSGRTGLASISFWIVFTVAILHLLAMLLSYLNISWQPITDIIGAVRAIANALMLIIVGILAWRYVAGKGFAWKLLYIILLLVVLACIVVPSFKLF
jgi:hypothetical protein